MALSKIIAEGIDLTDTFSFTGTVTGAGLTSPLANTVAVTSEGGAVTTNLVQGLVKCWSEFNNNNTNVLDDGFNVSSLSDDATGVNAVNFSNSMSSTNYAVTSGVSGNTNAYSREVQHSIDSTSKVTLHAFFSANNSTTRISLNNSSSISSAILGDLA